MSIVQRGPKNVMDAKRNSSKKKVFKLEFVHYAFQVKRQNALFVVAAS